MCCVYINKNINHEYCVYISSASTEGYTYFSLSFVQSILSKLSKISIIKIPFETYLSFVNCYTLSLKNFMAKIGILFTYR